MTMWDGSVAGGVKSAERLNSGKDELSYILTFPAAIAELAKVSMMGAKKYARGNYLRGLPYTS